jgi:DNA repair exonuclease SbcCD ATPase subunit
MILFKTIRWKNFLSTGNIFTEVPLDNSPSTLIVGSNGAGKSTILDALTFGLFNKPFRKINKPQLVNTTNEKDCLVEIEFSIGKKDFLIRRGIKPTVFEIHQNGKMLDQNSSAVDQQKHLEQNVLKLNFKSFTQIVILGSSTFVPFMQMLAAGRREVIEDILDIKIFSTMNALVKEKIKLFSDEIKDLKNNAELVQEKIDIQDRFVGDLQEQSQSRVTQKETEIQVLIKKIGVIDTQVAECMSFITGLQEMSEDPSKFETKQTKLNKLHHKMDAKQKTLSKEISFYDKHDNCPTCSQPIGEDLKKNKIKDNLKLLDEIDIAMVTMVNEIDSLSKKLDDIKSVHSKIYESTFELKRLNNSKGSIQEQIDYINNEINRIQNNNNNIEREKEKKQEFVGQKKFINKMISEMKMKKEEHDVIHFLLKDSGVKTRIIKKYLPLMNRLIRQYLQELDFSINFALDEEFNETIKSPIHENFSYASFSEGEKMRIDLALLFTWREVARVKNSVNTNLLILDEIFDSSLDVAGTDDFMKIIRFAVQDANIFVISHKGDLLQDKFADTIQFEKIKNFSKKCQLN